jgi:hypothetical protein
MKRWIPRVVRPGQHILCDVLLNAKSCELLRGLEIIIVKVEGVNLSRGV